MPARLRNWLFPVSLASVMLVLDQASKAWSRKEFLPNQSEKILGQDWFQFTHVPNPALMFHTLSWLPPGQIDPYIRYIPTALLTGFLVVFLAIRRLGRTQPERYGFWLFVAGGLSNLHDHWLSFFVTDTFKINLGVDNYFHPFNLADVCIGAGMGLLLLAMGRELYCLWDRDPKGARPPLTPLGTCATTPAARP